MVTGSVAANFYITPRMTRDTDIVIEVEEHDAERIFSLFSDEFYIDLDMMKDAIRRKGILMSFIVTGSSRLTLSSERSQNIASLSSNGDETSFLKG